MNSGFEENKIITIKRGADVEIFNLNKPENDLKKKLFGRMNPFVITFIGRIEKNGQIFRFFKGAKQVFQVIENVIFLIVGDGKLRKNWERTAKNFKLEERFIFTGFRYDIKEILSISDVFISPLISLDTYQNSLLEAMAVAKPVVAVRTDANLEVIENGVNGFLYSQFNEDEFVESVISLFKNRKLRNEIGANARKTVIKSYRIENVVSNLESLYLKVV